MRWPVDNVRITPNGDYGKLRTSRKFCGGKPPCRHWGIDIAGKRGTNVYAPETGFLAYVVDGDAVKPFSRLGPSAVVLYGASSGLFHVLGHLETPTAFVAAQRNGRALAYPTPATKGPSGLPMVPVLEGTLVGTTSDRDHVHWAMRRDARDPSTHVNPHDYVDAPPPASSRQEPREPERTSSGGAWFVILLLLAFAGKGGR